MNFNVTATIHSRNELHRLPLVCHNLLGHFPIIVFDGGSTDGTIEWCELNNIRVIRRPIYDKKIDHSESSDDRNFIFSHIATPYILTVFCSHLYPQSFLNRLSEIANVGVVDAVFHDVVVYQHGQVVQRPFFRRRSAACIFYKPIIIKPNVHRIHDELGIKFDRQTMVRLPAVDGLSLHLLQNYDSLGFGRKILEYSEVEAYQKFSRGMRVGFLHLWMLPVIRFIYFHFRRGSVLYGSGGLVYSVLNMINEILINIRMWELQNGVPTSGVGDFDGKARASLMESALFKNEKIANFHQRLN